MVIPAPFAIFRNCAFRRPHIGADRGARHHALRLLLRSGIVVIGAGEGGACEGGPGGDRRRRRAGRHGARAGAGKIRKNRRGAGRVRQGDRDRSSPCGSAVQPWPALSAAAAASTGDRRLHLGQRADAAAGGTIARPRDQLPRDGQGSRKPRPISTRRCRPTRRTRRPGRTRGLAYERLGDRDKAKASYARALAIRPKDEAARSGLARLGG